MIVHRQSLVGSIKSLTMEAILLLRLVHNVTRLLQRPLVDGCWEGLADPLLNVLQIGEMHWNSILLDSLEDNSDSPGSCGAEVWRTGWPAVASTSSPRTGVHLREQTTKGALVPAPENGMRLGSLFYAQLWLILVHLFKGRDKDPLPLGRILLLVEIVIIGVR